MKKFLRKFSIFMLLLIIVIVGIVAFVIFVVGDQHTQSYEAAVYDKIERLESIKGPKIVLVGNSSLSFGMNSQMLEQAMGMPVVNLGLHAGLGNSFCEEMAKLSINEGDIVIICYTSYENDEKLVQEKTLWETCEWNKEIWKLVKADKKKIIRTMPWFIIDNFERWITGTGNKPTDSCYSRNAFNEYGDVIYRPATNPPNFEANPVTVPKIDSECIDRINDFNQYVEAQKAVLIISAPPIGDGEYTDDKSKYEEFQNALEETLCCDVISDFTDYFIPYQYFYNENTHLTGEGADIRTQLLIDDLKKYHSGRCT